MANNENLNNTNQGILRLIEAKKGLQPPLEKNIDEIIKGKPQIARENLKSVSQQETKKQTLIKGLIETALKSAGQPGMEEMLDQLHSLLNIEESSYKQNLNLILTGIQESTMDNTTGLQNRRGAFQRIYKLMLEGSLKPITEDYMNRMEQIVVILGDGNNFKLANSSLGEPAVDEVIAEDGQKQIGASQFSSGSNEDTAYGNNVSQNNKAFWKEFPVGSDQYKLLELARNKGIVVERFRIGGDEFTYIIHYSKGNSDENDKIAQTLINYLSSMIIIPKILPGETQEQAKERIQKMCDNGLNYPRNFLCTYDNQKMQNSEIEIRTSFYKSLAEHLDNNDIKGKIIQNPNIVLRVDADMYGMNMQQAIYNHFNGKKTKDIDEEINTFKARTTTIASASNITDKEEIDKIYDMVVCDAIVGHSFDILMAQVFKNKYNSRINTLINAYKGDPHAFFKFAGLIHERLLKITDEDIDRVYKVLYQHYFNLKDQLEENDPLKIFFYTHPQNSVQLTANEQP